MSQQESRPWDLPEDTVQLIDKEPGVINNAMIREAYSDTKDSALDAAFDFDQIDELRLEFYDIMRIDHLNMCTGLVKLTMSNNVIKEITNLNKLVNLTTLNLSFNRITTIKGLETLEKLEELSLFNNEISSVENLESQMKNLRLLSLGCNKLRSASCLVYLRKFEMLSSLNLEGNPFVEKSNHNMIEIVGGLLPELGYYNYRMIRPAMREQGQAKLRSLISELDELESTDKLKCRLKDFVEKISQYLDGASISGFVNDDFYDRIISRDSEGGQLRCISNKIDAVFARLKDGLGKCSKHVVLSGVSFFNQRKTEVSTFKEEFLNDMLTITHQSTVVIREFMTDKSKLLKSLVEIYNEEGEDGRLVEKRMRRAIIHDRDFTMSRRKIWWDLMEREMSRHDKNEKNLMLFEDKLMQIGKIFTETIRVEFLRMRNMEEEFHVALSDQVNQYLVEIHLNEAPALANERLQPVEQCSRDLRFLLRKDKREYTINQSHRNHLSEIEQEEEKILNQVNEWLTLLIKKFCLTEIERNRKAIVEINKFVNHHKHDWADQTRKALTSAYSFMKAVDPNWTHEVVRIKMNSKERMLDDQMEAMFRERYQATAMRKRIELQVKEEQGEKSSDQANFEMEEKRELDLRAKRKAYRFAYTALLRRNTQMESIYQMWNSAEDLSMHQENRNVEMDPAKNGGAHL